MKVEIWSDVVCPYCYMGKIIFESALKKFPQSNELEIIWHSYQLDPSLNKGKNGDLYQYMADMEGVSYEEAVAGQNEVAAKARESGLVYNFDKAIITNTFDAHRLIHLAGKYKLADLAEEQLFKACFTEGLDISNHDVLLNIGQQIGLDKNQILQMLDSNEFANDVHTDIEDAENLNLYYVPFFLFDRKHIITGVVSEDDFLKVLNKVFTKDDADIETIQGKSCSLDGTCN